MTLYAQRCEQDASYPMKRHSFSPEIEYMYYEAQRKGEFPGVDPAEIRVEATKTSADENRSAAEACKSLVPLLRQEYMRHVSFRHFQAHLMNEEQITAANRALALIADQIRNEGVQVPSFEECVAYMKHKHQVAIEEKEMLHAARMPPPKRRHDSQESDAASSLLELDTKRHKIDPSVPDEPMIDKDQPACPLPPHMSSTVAADDSMDSSSTAGS